MLANPLSGKKVFVALPVRFRHDLICVNNVATITQNFALLSNSMSQSQSSQGCHTFIPGQLRSVIHPSAFRKYKPLYYVKLFLRQVGQLSELDKYCFQSAVIMVQSNG